MLEIMIITSLWLIFTGLIIRSNPNLPSKLIFNVIPITLGVLLAVIALIEKNYISLNL